MIQLDYHSIEDIDDCDEEQIHLLARDNETGTCGWHWVFRETLAEAGRDDLASYGLADAEHAG